MDYYVILQVLNLENDSCAIYFTPEFEQSIMCNLIKDYVDYNRDYITNHIYCDSPYVYKINMEFIQSTLNYELYNKRKDNFELFQLHANLPRSIKEIIAKNLFYCKLYKQNHPTKNNYNLCIHKDDYEILF